MKKKKKILEKKLLKKKMAKTSRGKGKGKTSGGKVGKVAKQGGRRKLRNYNNFRVGIKKVLTQVHPETGISMSAMNTMDGMLKNTFYNLCAEVSRLCLMNKAQTANSRMVQSAVRLCFPGELAKHAVSEGTKAITALTAKGSGTVKKRTSLSARAHLQFSAGRVKRMMKKMRVAARLSSAASVYMTAVLEYLAAEVLELAGNAARDNKKARVNGRFITLAVRHDSELDKLFKNDTVRGGGVLPNVHSFLVKKVKGKRSSSKKSGKKPSRKHNKAPRSRKGSKKGSMKSTQASPNMG